MFNLLLNFMLMFEMLAGGLLMENISLTDVFAFSKNIEIINNAQCTVLEQDSEEYGIVLESFIKMCEDCHEMPAYGVSLHQETVKQMEQGIYIQFNYYGTQMYNGMPFEGLLVEINPDYQGFNIIRKNDDKYEGRCFYIDLAGNMNTFYNTIIEIISANNADII